MGEKSFTLNPKFCFIEPEFDNPTSQCLFDSWSIQHFYWQGFVYLIIHLLLRIKTKGAAFRLVVILTVLHALEEYIDNISRFSLQGIITDYIGPLIDRKINPAKRHHDNDTLDNSIGDVISGLIACLLIVGYWIIYGKLPVLIYLIGIIPVMYLTLRRSHVLY